MSVSIDFESYGTIDLNSHADWVTQHGSFTVGGGQVWSNTNVVVALSRYIGHEFNSNQSSEVTFDIITPGGAGTAHGCAVRLQPGSDSGYYAYIEPMGNLYIGVMNNGSDSYPFSASLGDIADGFKLRLTATGAGSATRLTVETNSGSGWTPVSGMTNVDPGIYFDNGYPGVSGYNNAAVIKINDALFTGEIAPTAGILVDFEDYGSIDLDSHADWVTQNGSFTVAGGKVWSNTAGTVALSRYIGHSFESNQSAEATLNFVTPGAGSAVHGCAVRLQSGSNSGYYVYTDSNGATYLGVVNAGSHSYPFTASLSALGDGSKIRLTATGAGSATRLTVQYNNAGGGWATVPGMDNVDPGIYFDGGSPGLAGYNDSAAVKITEVLFKGQVVAGGGTTAGTGLRLESAWCFKPGARYSTLLRPQIRSWDEDSAEESVYVHWYLGAVAGEISADLTATLDDATLASDADAAAAGSVDATLGAATAASDVDVLVQAAVSATLGAATLSSTATVQAGGLNASLDATLGVLTSASTASVPVSASLSRTLGVMTGAATASVPIAASVSSTLGALTGTSSTSIPVQASVSSPLGALTGAATASVQVAASVSSTLGVLTSASTASVPVQASVSRTLGALTSASTASAGVAASVSSTLGALTGASTASIPVQASVSSTLGALTSNSTAAVTVQASLSATLGELACLGNAGSSAILNLTATLGTLTGSANGSVAVAASANITLGPVTCQASTGSSAILNLTATLGALTSSASTGVRVSGSVSSTLGVLTCLGNAGSSTVFSLTATLGTLTGSSGGSVLVQVNLSAAIGGLAIGASASVPVGANTSRILQPLTLSSGTSVRITVNFSGLLGELLSTIPAFPDIDANLNVTLGSLLVDIQAVRLPLSGPQNLRPEEVQRVVRSGMFYLTVYNRFEGSEICMVISSMEALDRAIAYMERANATAPHTRLLVHVPYDLADSLKQATIYDLFALKDAYLPVGSVDNVYSAKIPDANLLTNDANAAFGRD